MSNRTSSTSGVTSQAEQSDPIRAELTILAANSFVGKSFALGADGQIEKVAAGNHSEWGAGRLNISTAEEFVRLLEQLSPEMALVLGTAPDLPEYFSLTRNGTRRTRETFHLANGPGWLLLDYDTDQMPPGVKQRIDELGGPVAAMECVWPELKDACRVWKPSSSGGVHKTGDEAPADINGFHLYVLVSDQSKSKEILETLQLRAWADGLGWIKASASGALLTRSIFDTTVWGPERLVFAGPPELGEGVSRTAPPIVSQEGDILSPPQRPVGTAGEEAIRVAKEAIRPTAIKKERAWIKDQVRRVMTQKNVSARAAFTTVKAMIKQHLLEDDAALQMNDGNVVRVGDLLDQGRKVDKLSIPSPLDGLSYGTGKATLLWGEGRNPVIVDHAHGLRRVFRFARFADVNDRFEYGGGLPSASPLPDASVKGMTALLSKSELNNAGPNAMAVANRLFFSVPAQRSIDDLVTWVKDRLPPDILPDGFYQALESRLRFRHTKRKESVLRPYTLGANFFKLHRVHYVDSLVGAVAGLPTGVVVVRAPLGFGKTQHVGASLVCAAKKRGLSVMAMCHRVSLTAELANRFDLANYSQMRNEDIASCGGIAVCLPSTTRADIVEMMPKPDVVFIDEVRQVLSSLANPEYCRTKDANAAGVYERLKQLITDARTVIVADAHVDSRTLQFLQECRPGERFQIIIAERQQVNRSVEFRYGSSQGVRTSVIGDIAIELTGGGRVWLACESKKFAHAMERYFTDLGYRAIAITAETKNRDAQAAFLLDAEQSSLSYDIVIASPVISSGLSIEHRGAPHFTLVAFLGSGNAITPGDAVQQLARVRYVDRFLVGVMHNNLSRGVIAEQVIKGRSEALTLQGDRIDLTPYDRLVAELQADQANSRADFAAGLYWLLEREGWSVRRGSSGDHEVDIGAALDVERKAREDRLIAAPSLPSVVIIEKLRSLRQTQSPTTRETQAEIDDLEVQLEAARIREALGVQKLLPEDIELWDEGQLVPKVERFADFWGIGDLQPNLGVQSFAELSLRTARRKLYSELLAGYNIAKPDWLTPPAADAILDRVMINPGLYAACGIVGMKYTTGFLDKSGEVVPLKRPAYAVREVKMILERAGLGALGRQARVSQMGPLLVNTKGANCDRSRVWLYTTQGLVLMRDLARVWHETQIARLDPTREMPVSLRQLKRSLKAVLQWLSVAVERRTAY
ncbi:plasmid replication protein, CyRepA1 family [Roseovarius sp. S1116L3]|uniref:plasmid replication protein, CyRepA1 family n=1 Tax=Roseovarius roseus TaxID=3342636 RepID=UPI00372C8D63